jgi:hypothetical protein
VAEKNSFASLSHGNFLSFLAQDHARFLFQRLLATIPVLLVVAVAASTAAVDWRSGGSDCGDSAATDKRAVRASSAWTNQSASVRHLVLMFCAGTWRVVLLQAGELLQRLNRRSHRHSSSP